MAGHLHKSSGGFHVESATVLAFSSHPESTVRAVMNANLKKCLRPLALSGLIVLFSLAPVSANTAENALSGLWEARRIFAPEDNGAILIRPSGNGLLAEFGGSQVDVTVDDSVDEALLSFSLPSGGRFEGVLEDGGDIRGHWLQPRSKLDSNVFATPVLLHRQADIWRGDVTPQPDTGTLYLILRPDDDTLTAELINPERNLGIFQNLTRLERDGQSLLFHGQFRGRGEERVMFHGDYFPDEDVITLRYRGRGGTYEFHRIDVDSDSGFFARSSKSGLRIDRPPTLDDGWATGSMADAGIDEAVIRNMIETEILPVPTSTNDLSVHAVLIARHGKLVVEEYFHGYHRDLPHDSRSASKSVTSILAAAAMHSGADLTWDTPVYSAMGMDELLAREPERGAITLSHLMNMNSGLDCDDRNPKSAAQEDVLWDNADQLDFYIHTLKVDVVNPPGEVAAYCSASANLAGGVIEAGAERSLLQLIQRLVAEPLDIKRYSVPVPPDGHPFMGGGTRWLARDFLKFPQLMLDGGEWNKKRVLSEDNVRLLLKPAVKMDGGRDYGYLWWTEDYDYKGRKLRAHFMGGNGGQIAMLVPELDLTIVFNAGNYSSRVGFRIQEELIPNYILPAILD
jgi:CubicO group peptidase (beta-lactamase class C family)/uncharacterized protein YkuJ